MKFLEIAAARRLRANEESSSVGKILAIWISKNAEIIVDTPPVLSIGTPQNHATLRKNMP